MLGCLAFLKFADIAPDLVGMAQNWPEAPPNSPNRAQIWPKEHKHGRACPKIRRTEPRFGRKSTNVAEHAPNLVEARPDLVEQWPAIGRMCPKSGLNAHAVEIRPASTRHLAQATRGRHHPKVGRTNSRKGQERGHSHPKVGTMIKRVTAHCSAQDVIAEQMRQRHEAGVAKLALEECSREDSPPDGPPDKHCEISGHIIEICPWQHFGVIPKHWVPNVTKLTQTLTNVAPARAESAKVGRFRAGFGQNRHGLQTVRLGRICLLVHEQSSNNAPTCIVRGFVESPQSAGPSG